LFEFAPFTWRKSFRQFMEFSMEFHAINSIIPWNFQKNWRNLMEFGFDKVVSRLTILWTLSPTSSQLVSIQCGHPFVICH
jgi:hypothetical protein